jgi:hypothetical protein
MNGANFTGETYFQEIIVKELFAAKTSVKMI